jgi:SRSO17 transposase
MPEESWLANPDRCAAAGVPPDLAFATRPAHVIEMICAARAAGIPFAWFTADEEFGQNPGLCDHLETNRIPYVMAVPKSTQFTDTTGKIARCDKLASRLPRNTWQRRACGIGSKGFRVYDWALINSADPDHQYLIRRSINDGELAYYRCYNPNHASVVELVHVAGARWPIEECFGSAKNEVGLDDYQVRTWDAWHRHITLAMLAHTFLAVTAHKAKKGAANQQDNQPRRTLQPTSRPSRKSLPQPSIDVSPRSPSPKSGDSST